MSVIKNKRPQIFDHMADPLIRLLRRKTDFSISIENELFPLDLVDEAKASFSSHIMKPTAEKIIPSVKSNRNGLRPGGFTFKAPSTTSVSKELNGLNFSSETLTSNQIETMLKGKSNKQEDTEDSAVCCKQQHKVKHPSIHRVTCPACRTKNRVVVPHLVSEDFRSDKV